MCHTYYHVYVTFLKELKLLREAGGSAEDIGKADLVLSSLSNHFEDLKGRVERIGLFREVMEFSRSLPGGGKAGEAFWAICTAVSVLPGGTRSWRRPMCR